MNRVSPAGAMIVVQCAPNRGIEWVVNARGFRQLKATREERGPMFLCARSIMRYAVLVRWRMYALYERACSMRRPTGTSARKASRDVEFAAICRQRENALRCGDGGLAVVESLKVFV